MGLIDRADTAREDGRWRQGHDAGSCVWGNLISRLDTQAARHQPILLAESASETHTMESLACSAVSRPHKPCWQL